MNSHEKIKSFTVEEIRELRERFSKLYSGVVFDTLHEDIKPKLPYVLSKKNTTGMGI